LLDCAVAVFAEHGIARATHSQVAARAGVSMAAVHAYFRARADLVDAVLAEVEAYLLTMTAETLRPCQPPQAALLALARRFAADARLRPALIRVWLDWSTGVRDGVWPRYLALLDQLHARTRAVLRAGQASGDIPAGADITAAARLFIGGGHTVALMQFAGASPAEVEATIVLLVRGLVSRPAAPV
jgi:TetR/AcrR family hemagglutinin/protease transcriptional regulator